MNKSGKIVIHFKGVAPEDVEDSTLCSLDYADTERTPAEVSEISRIHRNNVRDIENTASRKFKKRMRIEQDDVSASPEHKFYYQVSHD